MVREKKLLGKEKEGQEWDQLFVSFCEEKGFIPDKRVRRYWVLDISVCDEYVYDDVNGNVNYVPVSTEKLASIITRVGQNRFVKA